MTDQKITACLYAKKWRKEIRALEYSIKKTGEWQQPEIKALSMQ